MLCETHLCAQLHLNGTYQGKNVFVHNPMNDDGDGDGYCTDSVSINGVVYSGFYNSSAFQIKLDSLDFQHGDSISIDIFHKHGCKPNVLSNFCFFTPKTGTIEQIELNPTGKLTWKASCAEKHSFIVEHYKWNRWVEVTRIPGNENDSLNTYDASCKYIHGDNTFRIKLIQENVQTADKKVTIHIDTEKVKCSFEKKSNMLNFSGKTSYEIYDHTGNRLLVGEAIQVSLSDFSRGVYFLNYDVSNRKITVR